MLVREFGGVLFDGRSARLEYLHLVLSVGDARTEKDVQGCK